MTVPALQPIFLVWGFSSRIPNRPNGTSLLALSREYNKEWSRINESANSWPPVSTEVKRVLSSLNFRCIKSPFYLLNCPSLHVSQGASLGCRAAQSSPCEKCCSDYINKCAGFFPPGVAPIPRAPLSRSPWLCGNN